MSDEYDDEIELNEAVGGDVVPFAAPSLRPKQTNEEEFGVPNTMPFGSWTTHSGELEADNHQIVPVENLMEMRKKDGQARALLRLLTLPIWRAATEGEWIAPAEGGGEKETEFMNLMWTLPPQAGGMTISWPKLVRQITLALADGVSTFEEVRRVAKDGPLKGKIVLKKLAYRDPRTIKFLVDKNGGFDGLRQRTVANGAAVDVKIPRDKCWYYAANEEENPFYGLSWFESAFFHYEVKKKLYYIAHVAAQMAAVPGRVGKMPEQGSRNIDVRRVEAVRKAMKDFAFNHSMIMPPGWDMIPFNANSGFNFLELVDHHNLQMSKSVMAKFLDDEQRQVLIENANAEAGSDFFVMALEAVMSEISESLSHYVCPKYIDWNFDSSTYPTYKFGVLADSTKDAIKELFTAISTAQSSMWTPEFIRELEKKLTDRLGLDVDYTEVEKREEEEAAKMEEQQRQELELYQQQFQAKNGGQQQEEPPQGPLSDDPESQV